MPVADSLEITRRIEGLNSIGQYNYGDARLFSSLLNLNLGLQDNCFIYGWGSRAQNYVHKLSQSYK